MGSTSELIQIFEGFATEGGYIISPFALEKLYAYFTRVRLEKPDQFGNGRAARNLFEETISRQAMRLASKGRANSPDDLRLLVSDDVPE
jgi:hypothetical protein